MDVISLDENRDITKTDNNIVTIPNFLAKGLEFDM